mgnify:CR=1 FL=1
MTTLLPTPHLRTAFSRTHPATRPYKASSTAAAESAGPTAGAPETAAATSGGAGASSSAAGGNDGSGCQAQLLIEEVYKPGRELRPIFEELKLK